MGENGIWIGYEDPNTIANKAKYVKNKGLGGLAFFVMTLDDYKGRCDGTTYPLLKAGVENL